MTAKKKTGKTFATAKDFQNAHKSKASKERALKRMSNSEIDNLIKTCPNVYAKNFYASFKTK